MFEFNSNQYGALYCIHNSQFIICCGRNRFERPLAGSIALAIACDTFDTRHLLQRNHAVAAAVSAVYGESLIWGDSSTTGPRP
jgi:hypothetical protein